MKTPRELLFEHHRAAEPKLDARRRAALETLNAGDLARETRLSLTPRLSGVHAWLRMKASRFIGFLSIVRHPAQLRSSLLRTAQSCWRELILPYRRIWSGLAAAWVAIFALAFASRDTSPTIAANSPPPSPEIVVALQNQKQLLAEMLADTVKASDTDRPKSRRPSPHSELMMPVITT